MATVYIDKAVLDDLCRCEYVYKACLNVVLNVVLWLYDYALPW